MAQVCVARFVITGENWKEKNKSMAEIKERIISKLKKRGFFNRPTERIVTDQTFELLVMDNRSIPQMAVAEIERDINSMPNINLKTTFLQPDKPMHYTTMQSQLLDSLRRTEQIEYESRQEREKLASDLESARVESQAKSSEIERLRSDLQSRPQLLGELSGGLDALFLEWYARTEVPEVGKLIQELEEEISDVMRGYKLSRPEVNERLQDGSYDIDDLYPEYAEMARLRDEFGDKIKGLPADMREALKDVPSYRAIGECGRIEAEHARGREVSAKLRRPRRHVLYYARFGEDEKEYSIDVYVPVRFVEDGRSLNGTEREIISIVREAWIDVKNEAKGRGEAECTNDRGITKYRLKVPKPKLKREEAAQLKDKFISKIYENASANPLAVAGVEFRVQETSYHTPPVYKARKAHKREPEISAGDSGNEYRWFVEKCATFDIRLPEDPLELFSTGERATRSGAVLLAIQHMQTANGETARRQNIMEYVEGNFPQLGAYARKGKNEVDNSLIALKKAGMIESPTRGAYCIKRGNA